MGLYADMEAYLKPKLTVPTGYDQINFLPGPARREDAVESFGPTVVLTLGSGPGFMLEGQFDRVGCLVDLAGPEGDYDQAEELAKQLDDVLTAIVVPTDITEQTRLLFCARSGGRPTPIVQDDGLRWHFGCGYVLAVGSSH